MPCACCQISMFRSVEWLHAEEEACPIFELSFSTPTACSACRAQDYYLQTTRCENMLGITAETGPALRLLYACLTPLSDAGPDDSGPGTYDDFLEGLPKDLRHGLECKHVLQLLRRALGVPPGEALLLLTLVDEGNAASGAFMEIDHTRPKVSGSLSSLT